VKTGLSPLTILLVYGMIKKATDLALMTLQESPSPSRIDRSTQSALFDLSSALLDIHNANLIRTPLDAIEHDFHLPPNLTTEWIECKFPLSYNKSKFLTKFNKDTSKYLRTEFFFGLVDWDLISTSVITN